MAMHTKHAWAAGFIDGEGTISVKRFFRYRSDGSKHIYYQPFISLSQSVVGGHEQGVIKMQKMYGGSIAKWKDKRPSSRYPTMQWSVVSQDALKCIKAIYPHLVVKKANAEIIFEFFKDRSKAEELFMKSRLLNQKGKLYLQRLSENTSKEDAIV